MTLRLAEPLFPPAKTPLVVDAHPAAPARATVKLPKLIEFELDAIVTYSMAEDALPVLPRAKRPRVEFEHPLVLLTVVDKSPNAAKEPVEKIDILTIALCRIEEALTPPAKRPRVLDEHEP